MKTLSNEDKARKIGESRKLLRARLIEARKVLSNYVRPYFTLITFNFAEKRLIGTSGWYLQWRIRPRPNLPSSYENQQTSQGSVSLENTEINKRIAENEN